MFALIWGNRRWVAVPVNVPCVVHSNKLLLDFLTQGTKFQRFLASSFVTSLSLSLGPRSPDAGALHFNRSQLLEINT